VSRASLPAAVALGALVVAWALPVQSVGCGQNAHYAATRSFADGHPFIDRYARETCDVVRRGGHTYASKGPLLDFWAAPWYMLLRAVHAVPPNPNAGEPYPAAMVGVPPRAVWQIALWAVVLPGLGLLLLVRRTTEKIEPGLGTAAAVVLGLGTLVLPFSTLLFAHVPAAMLAFASFALLFGGAGLRRVAAAGACAGLAISTDLPLAVAAILLGLYAAVPAPHLRRLAAFAAGGLAGLLPLFAFDVWAFGSPFRNAYQGTAVNPGAGGVEQAHVHNLFYTLTSPHPTFAIDLLFSQRGLLVLSPVVAAGCAGVLLLWRRGLRAEAALIAALCVAELVWNTFRPTYELALGGWVPGPRFLIPLLPFLCFAFAPVLRRVPATAVALALVSIGAMLIATSAEPLLSNDDTHLWIARIVHGNFAPTVLSFAGIGHGWLAILPFYALAAVAVAAAAATTPLTFAGRDLALAAAALVAWIVVEHGAPALIEVDRLVHQDYGSIAVVALVAGLAWTLALLHRRSALAALPGLPLLAFAARRFDAHTKWAMLLALLVLGALAAGERFPIGARSAGSKRPSA
jgi:hypothetical protein